MNDLDVPSEGPPVSTELTELSDREAVGIHGLLGGLGGSYPATRSTVHPGTTLALTRYSMVTDVDADLLRVAVFDALWVKGLDKGDASAPGEFGCPTAPPSATLQWWHDEWLGFDRPTVPTMAVSGGTGPMRIGILERLVELGVLGGAGRRGRPFVSEDIRGVSQDRRQWPARTKEA